MKKMKLEERVVSKIFLQSLGVYILSDIAQTTGPLVDAIVTAAWLGVDAVAANAIVLPAIMFLTFLSTMLVGGSRSIYTELLGNGKLDEANSVFTLANIAAAVSSIITTVLVIVFSYEIVGFLGASGKNAHLARFKLGLPHRLLFGDGVPELCEDN